MKVLVVVCIGYVEHSMIRVLLAPLQVMQAHRAR